MESVGVNRKEGAANRKPPTAFLFLDSLRVVAFPGGRAFDNVLDCLRTADVEAVRIMLIIVDFICGELIEYNKSL